MRGCDPVLLLEGLNSLCFRLVCRSGFLFILHVTVVWLEILLYKHSNGG